MTNRKDRPERTPEEQAILDEVAEFKGRPLTPQEENVALDQAGLIGELSRDERERNDGGDVEEL